MSSTRVAKHENDSFSQRKVMFYSIETNQAAFCPLYKMGWASQAEGGGFIDQHVGGF